LEQKKILNFPGIQEEKHPRKRTRIQEGTEILEKSGRNPLGFAL
jgi:hypothetical protein